MSEEWERVRLARNKSGYFELRWVEPDPNRPGRTRGRTYSCRTKDRAIAEDVRRTWLAAARQASAGGTADVLRELVDRYVRGHVDLNRVAASQRFALARVVELLGDDRLADLTAFRIAQYRKARAGKVKDGTIRRELGALRAALTWCVKNGELPADTVLPNIVMPPASQPRETYLSVDDEARMWGLARDLAMGPLPFPQRRIGYFVCLALETAARSGAIEGLTWDRVNMAQGVIDFREPGRRVSRKRRVPVPVSKRLRDVLADLWAREGAGSLSAPADSAVLGHKGSTRKQFERFRATHGFPGITRHDLRRTWATLRAQRGVSLFDIAGVLGDNVDTVVKHYAHHSPGHLRRAVDG